MASVGGISLVSTRISPSSNMPFDCAGSTTFATVSLRDRTPFLGSGSYSALHNIGSGLSAFGITSGIVPSHPCGDFLDTTR